MTDGKIEIRKEWSNAHFQKQHESARRNVELYMRELNDLYQKQKGEPFIRYIESRMKTPESIMFKLERKQLDWTVENMKERLYDISGVRVVCYDIKQIYWIAGKIAADKHYKIIKLKDYIRKPKKNGYESYHMILLVPIMVDEVEENIKLELQLRTIVMDAWASLDTRIRYKKNNKIPDAIEQHMQKYAKISQQLDKMILKVIREMK